MSESARILLHEASHSGPTAAPDHPNGSRIRSDSLGWEGHGHSNCLPCATAAHPSDLAVCSLSPRDRRGAARRRPLRRRPLWWRALFRQALRRGSRRRALRLAALLVRKALCAACGIRSVLYFGYFARWAVAPMELRHAGPYVIRVTGSVNASLVSAAISTPPRRPNFFCFLFLAPSSRFLLPSLSAVFFFRMLLQRRDPGLLLRTIFAAVLLLRWL